MEAQQPEPSDAGEPAAASEPDYAGFPRRFGAALVDLLILAVPATVLGGIAMPEIGTDAAAARHSPGYPWWLIAVVLGATAYKAGLEGSSWRATLGKRLFRIVVTDLEGRRVTLGTAVRRVWIYWLPGLSAIAETVLGSLLVAPVVDLLALLSCGMVAFTPQKQGLHDRMAKCLVLRK